MQAKHLLLFSFVYPPVYVIMFKCFHHMVNIKSLTYLFLLFRREKVFFLFSSDSKNNWKYHEEKETSWFCLSFGAKSADFVSFPALEDCWQLVNDCFSFQIHSNWFITVGQNSPKLASFVPKQLKENMSKNPDGRSQRMVNMFLRPRRVSLGKSRWVQEQVQPVRRVQTQLRRFSFRLFPENTTWGHVTVAATRLASH